MLPTKFGALDLQFAVTVADGPALLTTVHGAGFKRDFVAAWNQDTSKSKMVAHDVDVGEHVSPHVLETSVHLIVGNGDEAHAAALATESSISSAFRATPSLKLVQADNVSSVELRFSGYLTQSYLKATLKAASLTLFANETSSSTGGASEPNPAGLEDDVLGDADTIDWGMIETVALLVLVGVGASLCVILCLRAFAPIDTERADGYSDLLVAPRGAAAM